MLILSCVMRWSNCRLASLNQRFNGYEICRLLRKEALEMPIIMLTAKGEESDIVLGLNLGADDYVTKPFSITGLLASAAAFLRRAKQAQQDSFKFEPADT